jgi:hypothetical protein
MDGYNSHVNLSFIKYADINRILLAVFPPYSTHRPRDGSGQTRLGSGWAGLLGGLGHENYRALARRSGLALLV